MHPVTDRPEQRKLCRGETGSGDSLVNSAVPQDNISQCNAKQKQAFHIFYECLQAHHLKHLT